MFWPNGGLDKYLVLGPNLDYVGKERELKEKEQLNKKVYIE